MKSSILLLSAVSLAYTALADASELENGGFESGAYVSQYETVGTVDQRNVLTSWTVNTGTVDVIGTYWVAHEGSRSIDLNGSGTGEMTSLPFQTDIGASYRVRFHLAGNPDGGPARKALRVSVGDTQADFHFDTNGRTRQNMGWEEHSLEFVAQRRYSAIAFKSLVGGSYGAAIDHVVVDRTGAVPIGGTISGIVGHTAICSNLTSGQVIEVAFSAGSNSYDCSAAGLQTQLGDDIRLQINGVADGAEAAESPPEAVGQAQIEFFSVPTYDSHENLLGVVNYIEDLSAHRILVYIRVMGRWWGSKPTWAAPLTSLASNGTFEVDITTGGLDNLATELVAYLVKSGFTPPRVAGAAVLPSVLEGHAVTSLHVTR